MSGLRVGLSGGIGSGKSSVAAQLRELGAVIVDADRIAREVVAPGTDGLAAVIDRFGAAVRAPDGTLDRAALAGIVFADPGALRDLEAITHPLIFAETDRQLAAVPEDKIAVHDMPLLVEKQMSAAYHLVIVVLADAEVRVRRLVEHRGLAEADARARIRAQADDGARRAAADVLLDNDGSPADLEAATTQLYAARLLPFAANLRTTTCATQARTVPPPGFAAAQARRIAARVARAVGEPCAASGTTGWSAGRLQLELRIGAGRSPDVRALGAAGFPRCRNDARPGVVFGNCDPLWPSRIGLVAAD
ncbi:MAG: dephospho-CoA kinase [Tetrasphaera sp.]